MENYIVSARKYRPATFDMVVGQKSITQTLSNAILLNHLAHAYLFCGPRGVGKTTCARIFAKTINCQNLLPTGEACNECESCKSFNESRSFNIHELDAASNNSVDDIRNLIDQIRIPPQIGKYSIYIIDEVHMLSASAFNSFLKTLEEPPRHAIFILATTEKHKIIPTILSRCQIFDFNRIKVEDIVRFLQSIAEKENITCEVDGLSIIAQKADGAMRDALSIFDQIVSFSGNQVTYKQVIENLNVLDYDYYFKLTDLFLRSDYTKVLIIFNEILDHGFDSQNFIVGLAGHFRDLLICHDESTLNLLEVGAGIREKYIAQVKECPVEFLFQAIYTCNNADLNFRYSRNQRLHTELTLLQLTRLAAMPWNSSPKNIAESVETADRTGTGEKKNLVPKDNGSVNKSEEISANPARDSSSVTAVNIKIAEPQSVNLKPENPQVRPASFSIKAALKDKPTRTKKELTTETPVSVVEERSIEPKSDQPFTESIVKEKFREFVENLRINKPRMFNALKDQDPRLGQNFEVIFEMNNTSLQDVFNKEVRIDLLKFLRRELHNTDIQINIVIKTVDSGKSFLYTSEERFEYLNKKNPELAKFKQQMNLDFD
jgi:DNA polymerase III subunit gamma/tau